MTQATRDDLKVLATAGLILVDAMIFHEVLARFRSEAPTLGSIRGDQNLKRQLEDAWTAILNIDYEPVFALAQDILQNLPGSPVLNRELGRLLNIAYDIANSHTLLKHDLMGRIYHQLLLGNLVKYYATYYTSIPAARLLARLVTLLPSQLTCASGVPNYGAEPFRAVDFACGSGTLLSALYKELEARHVNEASQPDIGTLHKHLMEEGLWGFDVLQHATHLAMITLSLHEPSEAISQSRFYTLKLGKYDPSIYLGSPDFLRSDVISHSQLVSGGVAAERVSVRQRGPVVVDKLPGFHVCIMNPPFTRSVGGNLLFGDLPAKDRSVLQQALAGLLEEKGLAGIGQAGLGAVFVYLGDKYLKPGGRLALVLPKVVLSGVSWSKVRQALLDQYHVEFIISSFQGPDDWNFSENTSLSEVLLVARKLSDPAKSAHTLFVNLFRKPESEIESIHIGSQLVNLYPSMATCDIEDANAAALSVKLRGRKLADVYSARLQDESFLHLALFAQAELNRATALLRKGIVYLPTQGIVQRVPLTTLDTFVSDIGPDVRQVHQTFRPAPFQSGLPFQAFWNHDTDRVRTIEQQPNSSLEPKLAKRARTLWEKSASLLFVERGWLVTDRLLAIIVGGQVLSNVWWPIQTRSIVFGGKTIPSDDVAKLLALWQNSTYGLFLFLSNGEVTRGPWMKFKKTPLWKLPVLDFRKLPAKSIRNLLDIYAQVRRVEFKPHREEFNQPTVRRTLDEALGRVLGITTSLDELYRLLSVDPMITAGRID